MKKKRCLAAVPYLVLAVALSLPATASPAAGWVGTSTSHFALYTTEQHDGGQEILGRLETARRFFAHTGWTSQDSKQRVDILAFGPGNEFDSYRINPGAYAFYQRTHAGDFVIMRSLEPERYSVVVHEYTHFIMEHAGLKLPLWLNEGLADLYSTVQSRKAQVVVGAVPTGRDTTLNTRPWMDWPTLAAVNHHSPYYRQPDKMLIFYAQSWALTHMLALDAAYTEGFHRFLAAVSGGASTQDALATVYHKTLEQVGQELREYAGSKRMAARLVDLDARPGELEASEVGDAGKRVDFALAEVLAANPQTLGEAKSRLEMLTAKYPDDPRPEEALGFLTMRAGMKKDAQEHFSRAAKAGSHDAETLFGLAHLKIEAEGPSMEAIELLQRAVAADSTHYNARLELGFVAAKYKRFDLAIDALEKLGAPKPEHVYSVSYMIAYSLVELHQGNRAKEYAELARKQGCNPDEQEQAACLLRYIEQAGE